MAALVPTPRECLPGAAQGPRAAEAQVDSARTSATLLARAAGHRAPGGGMSTCAKPQRKCGPPDGASWPTTSSAPAPPTPSASGHRAETRRIGRREPRQDGHCLQAGPIPSSSGSLLHPRYLPAQGYARAERTPRDRPDERPGRQMSLWTARATVPRHPPKLIWWPAIPASTTQCGHA